jgi:predicted ribosomally synthesized peptide with nif11-like leader
MAGVKDFKEKVASDEAFAAKFENVKSAEELVEIAAKEGFTFTVADVNENSELIDAELEAVAGGRTILAKGRFVTDGSVFATGYFVTK